MRPAITFRRVGQSSVELTVRPGALLLAAAVRARLPIGRSCRGVGVCAACRVRVLAGTEVLSPRTDWETRPMALEPDERLACQVRVYGDVTITADYW